MTSSETKKKILKLLGDVEDQSRLKKVLELLEDATQKKSLVADPIVAYSKISQLEKELNERARNIQDGKFITTEELESESKSW